MSPEIKSKILRITQQSLSSKMPAPQIEMVALRILASNSISEILQEDNFFPQMIVNFPIVKSAVVVAPAQVNVMWALSAIFAALAASTSVDSATGVSALLCALTAGLASASVNLTNQEIALLLELEGTHGPQSAQHVVNKTNLRLPLNDQIHGDGQAVVTELIKKGAKLTWGGVAPNAIVTFSDFIV